MNASPQFIEANVARNLRVLDYCRSAGSAILGLAAGILGLENWAGFIFYALGSLFFSVLLLGVKGKAQPSLYFKGGALEMGWEGVLGGLLSFVLFWTFSYGLVHVYD